MYTFKKPGTNLKKRVATLFILNKNSVELHKFSYALKLFF